jgi:hypothetical protein
MNWHNLITIALEIQQTDPDELSGCIFFQADLVITWTLTNGSARPISRKMKYQAQAGSQLKAFERCFQNFLDNYQGELYPPRIAAPSLNQIEDYPPDHHQLPIVFDTSPEILQLLEQVFGADYASQVRPLMITA